MKNIVITIALILLFGCHSPNKNIQNEDLTNPHLIIFDENKAGSLKSIPYSDLFVSYHFVPLETKKESLLSNISQIKLVDKKILILDKGSVNKVLLFNENGRHIRTIKHSGQGPGEYLQIGEIDTDTNYLFVLDPTTKKIITYDLNGDFIEEFRLHIRGTPKSFQYVKNGQFLVHINPLTNGSSPILYLVDSKGKVIKEMLGNGIYTSTEFGQSSFYRTKSDIKFMTTYMNRIYQFKDGKIRPFIEVNSTKQLDIKQLADLEKRQGAGQHDAEGNLISTLELYKSMWAIRNYFETHDFIFFQFYKGLAIVSVFIDKSSKLGEKIHLVDDMLPKITYENFLASDSIYFIKKFTPGNHPDKVDDFKNIVNSNETVSQMQEIKQRLLNINIESNPVLIFYRVK